MVVLESNRPETLVAAVARGACVCGNALPMGEKSRSVNSAAVSETGGPRAYTRTPGTKTGPLRPPGRFSCCRDANDEETEARAEAGGTSGKKVWVGHGKKKKAKG
ncbi:hypothetical protein MRX96_012182 [Rhipicephalus microplus]